MLQALSPPGGGGLTSLVSGVWYKDATSGYIINTFCTIAGKICFLRQQGTKVLVSYLRAN